MCKTILKNYCVILFLRFIYFLLLLFSDRILLCVAWVFAMYPKFMAVLLPQPSQC